MIIEEEKILVLKRSLKQAHKDWSEEKITNTAFAIYNSKKNKTEKKEILHSAKEGIDWKEELEKNTFYSKGYAATTDYDGVGDILTLNCLYDAATQINNLKQIDSDEVSYRHDRSDPKPIAIAEHSASVSQTSNGSYGLLVTSNHVKTHDKYDEYVYDVKNGVVKGYSIEYLPIDILEDTRVFDENGTLKEGHRIIDKIELRGYGYASGRFIANPNARLIEFGYKEIFNIAQNKNRNEFERRINMVENENKEKSESKNVDKKEEKIDVEKLLNEAKEINKEAISIYVKEVLKDDLLKKEVNNIKIEEKIMHKEAESKMTEENIELKELKSLILDKEMNIDAKFKQAGLISEKLGILKKELINGTQTFGIMEVKNFTTNGSKLEFKGLGITTNQNTDTDYLLSAAELRDVFDPIIYDALNQSTTTWSLMRKDDFSNKGNNLVQFILETGANATAGFYTGNSVSTAQSTLLKMQTKFKKVQVGVSVDGDMIASAKGSPFGDVFGLHVRLATKTLLNTINTALFAEVGAETAAAIIGFEYITDSAGNTTLYNLTRSTANKLSPDAAADTYINGSSARISVDNLRKAIEQAVKEGADLNNLVFITHPTQERLFKGIYDASQRLMPTSSRFGFVGRPEFDAVPIFADKSCNSDDWWLVDLDSHRIAIWVPPTLEMLGKSADSVEGFIKSYLATYNTAPRRMVQIYGNATS